MVFMARVPKKWCAPSRRQTVWEVTGITSPETWAALHPHIEKAVGATDRLVGNLLIGFRGDLDWVHFQEGHVGKPYWPGGKSGVTLDPGIDLGYIDRDLFENLYGTLFSHAQLERIRAVFGLNREAAKNALAQDRVLRGIRVSRKQAEEIMPFAARSYWRSICERFPSLPQSLGAVQTVLLSLAYNRGAGNKDLAVLGEPLEQQDAATIADLVGAMQQEHELEGIRTRRRWEAALIRDALENNLS